MGLVLAFGAGYIWWSWKPEKWPATPSLPPFEERNHKKISPSSKPETFRKRFYPQMEGLPLVAIVIDDLGYQKQLALDFIDFEAPLTLSFLPQAPFSKEMVSQAFQKGKETLLHLPMEPNAFPQNNPGPKALLTSMTDEEIRKILEEDLEAFPQVVGVNNHMGSRFTEDRDKMALVLRTIKERKLFFFDSRTTPHSVILPLASQVGVKAIERDIFLDNSIEEDAIRGQLELLIRLAQKRGFAVASGHPYPQTLRAIKEKFPDLKDKVRLVSLSKLL
jgi:polysaccharide deacetylase 2 family uncharacterized protein YibQ